MSAKDSVIVLSGGLDSVTLLHAEKERIALAVTFDYGSRHNRREIECARHQCRELGIEHIVVPLNLDAIFHSSSLLASGDEIPKGNYAEDNMRSTVVPFRNGIMLAVACGLAEDRGLKHVMLANHSGDHAIYPDCRPEFVAAMSAAMQAGTYDGVTLVCPFTHLTKAEIVARGIALGVDYAHTYSCYEGGELHCGQCGTCRERRQAFADNGFPDPVAYQPSSDN